MRLTVNNISHYLVDKGFLSTQQLIDGDFIMHQTQSRNCIFHIAFDTNTGLFVKQLVQMNTPNIYLMQKDATAHYLIHASPLYQSLKPYIPVYHGYDPKRNVLVLENYSNAQNLYEAYQSEQKLSISDAEKVADILTYLHQDINEAIDKEQALQFFDRDAPWMLKLSELSTQEGTVLALIQNDELLLTSLHRLYQEWEGNSLIHGDVKFVNFLKVAGVGIKLVDWEIASIGDPLWDVAGFIHSYLSFWSLAQTQSDEQSNNEYVSPFFSLKSCKESILAFWRRYAENQTWDTATEEKKLIKTCEFTAVRILQTAKEASYQSPNQAPPRSTRLVQLAHNIFKSPIQAATDLMGIKLESHV